VHDQALPLLHHSSGAMFSLISGKMGLFYFGKTLAIFRMINSAHQGLTSPNIPYNFRIL